MKKKKNKKSPVSVLCSALGTVLLVLLIVMCIPLTLPKLLGYQIYTVVSGSMEPEIPIGSLVLIGEAEPDKIETDEVIAFYGGKDTNAVITHRVVDNRVVMGEFITKGDANQTEDMNPVAYDALIGRVEWSIPVLGGVAQTFTSLYGKVAAASLILLAVILHVVAGIYSSKKT